jgi:DNA-binding XRE family transcriptional regulator
MASVTTMKRPRLQRVQALTDFRLRLTFVDGSVQTVDLKPLWDESPGLAPLRADQAAFKQVRLIPGEGWAVVWPAHDIQIGADTLWLDAQAQNAVDENTRAFAQWRARNGLSLADAARALGLTPRTISAYGTGARPVPRYIALACKGWEVERQAVTA